MPLEYRQLKPGSGPEVPPMLRGKLLSNFVDMYILAVKFKIKQDSLVFTWFDSILKACNS